MHSFSLAALLINTLPIPSFWANVQVYGQSPKQGHHFPMRRKFPDREPKFLLRPAIPSRQSWPLEGREMRRIRLSTLMLLIVVVGLCAALVVRERQAARREADLRRSAASREAKLKAKIAEMELDDQARWKLLAARRARYSGSTAPSPDARFPLPPD